MSSVVVAEPEWAARLAALAAASGAATADSTVRCADGDLGGVVVGLEVVIRRLQAAQAGVVADAASRGVPVAAGARDGAGWLRSLTNMTPTSATVRARVGEALLGPRRLGESLDPDLQPARDAVLAGVIPVEHADVVLDTADRLTPPAIPPDALDPAVRAQALTFLVEHGSRMNVHRLRTAAQHLITRLDPHGDTRLARDEDRQAAHRGLTLSRMGTGMVHLVGTLTSQCAGLLATAIDAGSAPRPGVDGTPDDRTAAMRRHDSLEHLVEGVVAADGMLPSTHGTAYRLVVTVPHDTLHAAVTGAPVAGGQPAVMPDGWPISAVTTATLACAGELVPVAVDGHGNPLDVGDTQYLFPPRIRTAIIARDGGCTWPGCGAPAAWCDTHHLRPFSAGGPTAIVNGALLCGRHHRHVHTHGHIGELIDGTVHWNTAATPRDAPVQGTGSVVQRLIDHLAHRQRRHTENRRQ